MSRKKILILFPLEHIAFSPTTLGIYDALSVYADVTIYCPGTTNFKVENIGGRNIQYFNFNTKRSRKIKALPYFIFNKIWNLFNSSHLIGKLPLYDFVRYLEYKKAIKKHTKNYDEVIAVDMMLLYLSQFFYTKASFVSLELTDIELPLLKAVNNNFIQSVVVQTKQRYNYLFGSIQHNTFFVQNAPIYTPLPTVVKKQNAFLYNGTATPWFGLYHCLDFVKKYPQFSLTFKGAFAAAEKATVDELYKEEIDNGVVVFNKEYMESSNMLMFMSQYEIGFCFYDLSFPKINTFNYHTAPSGKMFAYLAAGVPVIGNDLDGLRVVEDYEAGILIKDFEPDTILNAVNTIKLNYDFYKNNCYKAAQHYSFDKNVAPFVEFLIKGA